MTITRFVLVCVTAASVACGPERSTDEDNEVPDAGQQPDAGQVTTEPRCEATPVTCFDESLTQLRLFDVVNEAAITEETAPEGEFRTHVDARGGGLTPNTSFVYGRFTESGLEKVRIGDEDAAASLDWDIAIRRYVVRLNSGVSGPSCVHVARVPPGPTFETLGQVPADLSYRSEAYFTDSCEYVADTSGAGAPGTALSSFWTYEACVQMTGHLYVVHLRDGRYVKLQITGYYDPEPQQVCNETGEVPQPSGAGNVRLRWAFVDAP